MSKAREPSKIPEDAEGAEGAGRSRIFIGPEGEVVVENLTPALLEVALALDPDDPRLRAIASAVAPDAGPPAPSRAAPLPALSEDPSA
jgi:hypothetical protein